MDWSQLPPDLLRLISNKLPDVLDFVRFRAVCPRWQSAVPASDPRPFLPWIVKERPNGDDLCCYSPFSGEHIRIRIPAGAHGMKVVGSSHGYVLATQSGTLRAFNPLTGAQLPLPPVSDVQYTVDDIGGIPNPIRGEDGVVLQWPTPTRLSIWRPGDPTWSTLDPPRGWSQLALYRRRLFLVEGREGNGDTKVIDPATLRDVCAIPPPPAGRGENGWLVESSGELLMVVRHEPARGPPFGVYRLDQISGLDGARWVETMDIGDSVVFLADRCFGFSCKASDVGLRANSVYCMERHSDFDDSYALFPTETSGIVRHSINNGWDRGRLCQLDGWYYWLLPSHL